MEENTGNDKPKPCRTGQRTAVGKDKHLIRVFLGCDANGVATELTEGGRLVGEAAKA